jgi:CRP/FNR family transcriptional regulator, cyclic AMP receptor protein
MSLNPSAVMTLEALRSVPLFAKLDDLSTAQLRDLLDFREVSKEALLCKAGDEGGAMFLIVNGKVRISVSDADGKELTLAELSRGDFFGEMALLDGRPRSADAKAIEPTTLAVLERDDFHTFVRQRPDVALAMMSAIAERLRRTDDLLRKRVSRNVNEEEAAR